MESSKGNQNIITLESRLFFLEFIWKKMLLRLNSASQAQPTSLGDPKYPRSNSAPFSLPCCLGLGDAPEHEGTAAHEIPCDLRA